MCVNLCLPPVFKWWDLWGLGEGVLKLKLKCMWAARVFKLLLQGSVIFEEKQLLKRNLEVLVAYLASKTWVFEVKSWKTTKSCVWIWACHGENFRAILSWSFCKKWWWYMYLLIKLPHKYSLPTCLHQTVQNKVGVWRPMVRKPLVPCTRRAIPGHVKRSQTCHV